MRKRSYALFAVGAAVVLLLSMVVSDTALAANQYNKPRYPHNVCRWVLVCHWKKVWYKFQGKLHWKWGKDCRPGKVCKVLWY